MRYLISFDTNIVGQEHATEWGVDQVLALGFDLKKDLTGIPQDGGPLVFFISTVFDSSNSLAYEGADFALRILMYYIREGRTDVSVVLMGNETESSFLLHYVYPNILKIPGMEYVRFNRKIVAAYNPSLPGLQHPADYKPYLDNLGLRIPSSFKSTHSLTNEWCLYKWNAFMGFTENRTELEGHLFFDYLITVERLNRTKSKTASDYLKDRIRKLPAARILLIDDKEGWHRFFSDLFSLAPQVCLHCLGADFNKLKFEEIEKKINDEVSDFNPDIIILDFRLMEDKDAEIRDNMKQISGYRVLSGLLKGTFRNPLGSYGRQVIVFTATSRIENIMMLRAGNADGFILKEKPETYNGKEITKDVISKMVSTLSTAITRAAFLIPLNLRLAELDSLPFGRSADLGDKVRTVTESVRLITQNNELDEGVLKLTYLNLFSILEYLKPHSVKFLNTYIQDNAPNETLKCWNNLDSIRNSLAHGDNTVIIDNRKEKISISIIQKWGLILCDFITSFINHIISNG